MEEALLSLALLLIVAKVAEGVAARLGQSSLVAYVLTGVVLGPVLGAVEATDELRLFFGVGVVFLFFLIGVDEIDISGFVETLRGRFFLAASVAFLVPLGISLPVTYYLLDLTVFNAIAIAGLISLSSLGVVASVLKDMDHLREPLGLEIFTTVVMVELVGLLVVGFSLEELESPGAFSPWKLLVLLGQIAGFAVVSWVLASHLFPPVVIRLRQLLGVPQLPFGLLIGVLFLIVVGAEEIGLHVSLGALLLGTALAGIPHRLRSEVLPGLRSMAQGVFIPLFFASAGLHLDTSFTALGATTIAAIVSVTVLGKLAGSALASYGARLDAPLAITSGLMAKGVVEIALLLVMVEEGAITKELFSLFTIIMLGFILVVPQAISFTVKRARVGERPQVPNAVVPSFARYALDEFTVDDVLDPGRRFPPDTATVKNFTEQWVTPEQHDYVVADEDGHLAGVLSLRHLRRVPTDRWDTTPISTLVQRRFPRASPHEPIDDVLECMADHAPSVIPVVDPESGELAGEVTSRDVFALLTGDSQP